MALLPLTTKLEEAVLEAVVRAHTTDRLSVPVTDESALAYCAPVGGVADTDEEIITYTRELVVKVLELVYGTKRMSLPLKGEVHTTMFELMPRDAAPAEGVNKYVQSTLKVGLFWKAYRLPRVSPAYSCAGLVPMASAPMSAPLGVVRVVTATVLVKINREIEPARQPM